ncbi:MTOR-associated protein MEAK7-like [Macrobrachium rosenbergii]|uniref:MTOR-associated protein MEAK7-like n=1 Tax=Macrobrachium rosenbergii TaxID=79674 RepID=UPI0034D4BFA0
MGAEGSKAEKNQYFSAEEHQLLLQTLSKIDNNGEKLSTSSLEAYFTREVTAEYGALFIHALTNGKKVQSFPVSGLAEKLGSLIKGSTEERINLTLALAHGGKIGVNSDKLLKYLEMIIEFFEKGITQKGRWKNSPDTVRTQIAFAVLLDLFYPNEAIKKVWGKGPPESLLVSYDAFERWWLGHCIFSNLEMEMFKYLFKFSPLGERRLLPQATQLPKVFPTMLSAAEVMFLNGALPMNLQSEWRFIFSTTTHGWSFSIFMKQIVGKGPTIIVIEDQSGNKFGGYASVSWEVRPQFHGTQDCFLFCLQPQAGIFHSTGYNSNYMYLNYLEKNTMPNGLGMGGREELFGLWLDYDFGKGTVAPTCTTFASPQLSPHQELEISSIEVWALGPEEEDSDEEEGTRKKKSALDKNPEARAMLDMMGKVAVSDGYREEDNDD